MNRTPFVFACALALVTVPAATSRANDPAGSQTTAAALGDVASTITVTRLIVATGVSEREPVGAAGEFATTATSHLYAFVEVENPTAEATDIAVAWIDLATGETHRSYVLEIGPHRRWRTWARAAAPRQPGSWAVVLTDAGGLEIGRAHFTMTAQ
jgi:hypothetical protein